MIPPDEMKTPIKVAGYLEKRSKMRVVCRWKKLWFVLEGRLLLYYKSQLEYLSLSPCRGTVNLGLAADVSPGKSNEIIVSTRSNTVSLRALTRTEHDVWLQALMDAMHLPNSSQAICCSKPVRHFRYSTGGLEEPKTRTYGDYLMTHAHTLSGRISPVAQRPFDIPARSHPMSETDLKIERLAQRYNKIASSDTTIPDNFMNPTSNSLKANLLRRTVSVEDEVNRCSENIYETVDSKRYRNYSRRVMRSDSDRLVARERVRRQPVFRSEQRIKTLFDASDNEAFIDMFNKKILEKCASTTLENPLRMKFGSDITLEKKKDIRSDTNLSLRSPEDLYHASSCTSIYCPTDSRNTRLSRDFYPYSDYSRSDDLFGIPCSAKMCKKPKRSNSILRHFMRTKTDACSPLMKKQSVKRRSLSFLKKIWRKKEPKFDDDISFNTELDMQEIHHNNSDLASSSVYSAVEMSADYEIPQPEPAPDYGRFTDVEDGDDAPELPPRLTRGPTPWDDPPQAEEEAETSSDQPPELPVKKNKKRRKALEELVATGGVDCPTLHAGDEDPDLRLLFREQDDSTGRELSQIMAQLAEINAAPLKYTTALTKGKKLEEEPDYDIPRPHDSLLYNIQKNPTSPDTMQPTHFFSNFEDSLDVRQSENDESPMAPDSLECDPWSLSESESTYSHQRGWSPTRSQLGKTIVSSTYGSNREIYFKDTIKTPLKDNHYLNMSKFIQLHS